MSTPMLGDAQTSWFTPPRALCVFSIINLLTYLDRGAFSACLDQIEKDMNFSNTDGGLIGSAYLIGFVVASMIFAQISQKFQPLRFMACALLVWCVACVASGFGFEFYSLAAARCLTGVGEAAFIILAPPYIDIAAPTEKRSMWLSIFYIAIPLGYALGFVIGGKFLHANPLGDHWTWRVIFIFESLLMLPWIIVSLLVKGPASLKALAAEIQHEQVINSSSSAISNVVASYQQESDHALLPGNETFDYQTQQTQSTSSSSQSLLVETSSAHAVPSHHDDLAALGEWDRMKKQLKVLLFNWTFVSITLGYAALSFVTGGFAYFGIQFLQKQYGWDVGSAGLAFGGITAFTGIVGTGFGGYYVDRVRKQRNALDDATASEVAMKIILIFTVLSWPICCAGFIFQSQWLFFGCTFVAEFFIFSTFSPVNSVLMWVVPIPYRPMSMAVSVLGIHLLGDALSPIIIGYLVDKTGNWNLSMLIMSFWLFWGVLFYAIAFYFARQTAQSMNAASASTPGSLKSAQPVNIGGDVTHFINSDGNEEMSFSAEASASLLGSSI